MDNAALSGKVLVFGAAGQIGRAVIASLLQHGHTVRAFERSLEAWHSRNKDDGPAPDGVELVYGDIVSYSAVSTATEGCEAIIHAAVYFPPSINRLMPDYALPTSITAGHKVAEDIDDETIWLVNLKGLFNVLEAARRHKIKRVVHLGSAHAEHPSGQFNSAEVRRGDGSLYAVSKRLQEEMCRQFHEAHGVRIIVLRPDYVVDAKHGVGRFGEVLPGEICAGDGWVDRHDLADAARLALTNGGDFDVLHTVASTAPRSKLPEELCNVAWTRETLGWFPQADLDQFRPRNSAASAMASMGDVTLKRKTPADAYIDSHCHIWTSDLATFPLHPGVTAADLKPPSFTAEDLLNVSKSAGVGRFVLVSHNVFHGSDNSYLTHVVQRYPDVFRVCAIIDEDRDMVGQMRALLPLGATSFRINPYKNGCSFLEKKCKAAWLHDEMWKEASHSGQVLCCLIDPTDLSIVDMMCERFPGTSVVIDHLARCGCDGEVHTADVDALCALARHPNTYVKLSAFYALGTGRPPYADIEPMLKRVIAAFGCERLMWGSDLPYQLSTAHAENRKDKTATPTDDYRASLFRITSLDLGAEELSWLLHRTAEKLFFGFPLCVPSKLKKQKRS